MGGLSGATIAEADKDSSNAVVYKVGMARMMETIRKLDERDADYAVLRAIESTRRGSAVQFVVESDGVPPYREIVKDQEPEDIGRVPVAVVRRAKKTWAEARLATDDRAIFVHMVDVLLRIPGNKNFDFAGADDYWAAGKLELRYTYLLHGVSLALEKAIVPGYVTKSGEIDDLVPYDDKEEIARVPVMIFVATANDKGVDTRIRLNPDESGFEDGYDRLVYIGTHFPSTLVAFVRRAADGTEQVLTSPALKLACALKAGKNLRRGRAIVDVEAYVSSSGHK